MSLSFRIVKTTTVANSIFFSIEFGYPYGFPFLWKMKEINWKSVLYLDIHKYNLYLPDKFNTFDEAEKAMYMIIEAINDKTVKQKEYVLTITMNEA